MTQTKVTLVREVVETDYSGEHSVKTMQTAEAEIIWPDDKEPVVRNPNYSTVGPWQVAKVKP
jgi:hypothetical protein